jgi:hypothetical protein
MKTVIINTFANPGGLDPPKLADVFLKNQPILSVLYNRNEAHFCKHQWTASIVARFSWFGVRFRKPWWTASTEVRFSWFGVRFRKPWWTASTEVRFSWFGVRFRKPWWTASTEVRFSERRWSCRESNPGPDKQPIRFLHAYSVVGFRNRPGNRQPNLSLSPFFSSGFRRVGLTIPDSRVPLDPRPQGEVLEEQPVLIT